MRAQVGRTSTIAKTDDSGPMGRICFGPNHPTTTTCTPFSFNMTCQWRYQFCTITQLSLKLFALTRLQWTMQSHNSHEIVSLSPDEHCFPSHLAKHTLIIAATAVKIIDPNNSTVNSGSMLVLSAISRMCVWVPDVSAKNSFGTRMFRHTDVRSRHQVDHERAESTDRRVGYTESGRVSCFCTR